MSTICLLIEEHFVNQRIKDIFGSLNKAIHPSIRYNNLAVFNQKIDTAYHILREN